MNDSAKQLLDQLINKVERAQNEERKIVINGISQATLKSSLLCSSQFVARYRNPADNGFFGELNKYLVKKSLSELTLKTICKPHLNPEESRENVVESPNPKKEKESEKPKRKRRSKSKDCERRTISGREDIKNLLYSHFPKYLNSCFRFRIGELAYVKWHNEMCLVVVNYASQKLLVSSDMDFEDPSENNEMDRNSQLPQIERRNVWLFDLNEEIYLDSNNHNLYSKINQIKPITLVTTEFRYSFPNLNYLNLRDKTALKYYFIPLYYVCFPGYKKRCSKLFRFWVQEKDLIKFNSVKFIPTVPLDVNPEDIPEVNVEDLDLPNLDVLDSVVISAEPVSGSDIETAGIFVPEEPATDGADESEKQVKSEGSSEPFSGVKKESDAELEDESENELKPSTKSELGEKKEDTLPRQEMNFVINKVKGDKVWNKRKIVPVNEYVYEIVHNLYNHDLVSGRYRSTRDFFCNSIPWIIPSNLRKIMVKDHKRIVSNSVNLKLKLRYRRSIHCIVQNFKYLLLMLGKYYCITNLFYTESENPEDKSKPKEGEELRSFDLARVKVSQMKTDSLSCLKFLESCLNMQGPIKFNEIYLNNFYWLDLLVWWIDSNFLNHCCFTKTEYLQLLGIRKMYKRPMSQILGFEYLCRVLSFDVFYVNFLSRIYRNGRVFAAYNPILQLLLYYMSFVSEEYTNGATYGLKGEK